MLYQPQVLLNISYDMKDEMEAEIIAHLKIILWHSSGGNTFSWKDQDSSLDTKHREIIWQLCWGVAFLLRTNTALDATFRS
jgi:hypothetical protein